MKIRICIAATAVAVSLGIGHPAAAAAEPGASGWWTSAPAAVAPDAEDALVVQGGPQAEAPVSFAAVAFTLAEGEIATGLRLTVVEGSGSTPASTLTVCAVTATFAPADGGAMADAPPYNCAAKVSAPATEGVYTFDVSSLSSDGGLALAVLPGAPSDRVVLSRPGADALETSRSGTTDASDTGDASFDSFDTGNSFDTPAAVDTTAPSSTSSFDVPMTDVPAVTDGSTTAGAGTLSTAADDAPAAFETAASTTSADGGGGGAKAPLLLVALIVLAAGLWAAAGRGAAEPDPGDHSLSPGRSVAV